MLFSQQIGAKEELFSLSDLDGMIKNRQKDVSKGKWTKFYHHFIRVKMLDFDLSFYAESNQLSLKVPNQI